MINQIINQLHDLGIIDSRTVKVAPLTGGVSSFVWHLFDGSNDIVVKYPRHSLNLPVDWPVALQRNIIEQDFFSYTTTLFPDNIPVMLARNSQDNWFCMSYFEAHEPWKKQLLNGQFSLSKGCEAAKLLHELHHRSKGCHKAEAMFSDTSVFEEMRVKPYFKSLMEVYPQFQARILDACNQLLETKTCLIHGDFSPKNILVGDNMVLIDAETAVYGDPLFDVAFFINHLLLKGFIHAHKRGEVVIMIERFLNSYAAEVNEDWLVELLLWLLLARVDGWSPVEYLDETQQQQVRQFTTDLLKQEKAQLNDFLTNYVTSNKDIK